MRTTTKAFSVWAVACASVMFVGCDKQKSSSNSNDSQAAKEAGAALPTGLFVTARPANPKTVEEVKSTAKPGDSVVVRGRVGGSMAPFVEGRAVFTLMGSGLKACSDSADDECPTPWDYCCDTAADIAKHSAIVQVVDASGAPVKADLKGKNGIKELSELVVVGKIVQANEKATIISANAVFIAKP